MGVSPLLSYISLSLDKIRGKSDKSVTFSFSFRQGSGKVYSFLCNFFVFNFEQKNGVLCDFPDTSPLAKIWIKNKTYFNKNPPTILYCMYSFVSSRSNQSLCVCFVWITKYVNTVLWCLQNIHSCFKKGGGEGEEERAG